MKVTIEIPVQVDGTLNSKERRELVQHIKMGLQSEVDKLNFKLTRESRMLGTICRFRFCEPKWKVE